MTQYDLFVPNDRFGSNTYLLFTEDDACVIDASVPLRQIRRAARPPHISFVLLTHGHFDHILALSSYAEAGIPIYMAGEDIPMLTNAYRNASLLFGQDLTVLCRPTAIKQGDSLSVGGVPIQTIASPGHTPGSLCFSVDRFLFTRRTTS